MGSSLFFFVISETIIHIPRQMQFLLWNELEIIGGNYMTTIVGIVLLALAISLIMKGD